ncbi:hypothetical protein Misp01_29330 [Microtetraspora sp. NBRC 13810]|nr:hypothetical protein Misp01_29330 [Microtetraspora sp. NBRC 13810]
MSGRICFQVIFPSPAETEVIPADGGKQAAAPLKRLISGNLTMNHAVYHHDDGGVRTPTATGLLTTLCGVRQVIPLPRPNAREHGVSTSPHCAKCDFLAIARTRPSVVL